MSDERRCIYCMNSKGADDFNREHVVPQAFGMFEQNLVLECVCKDCNDFFANELDLKLARDTVEGLDRYRGKAHRRVQGHGTTNHQQG